MQEMFKRLKTRLETDDLDVCKRMELDAVAKLGTDKLPPFSEPFMRGYNVIPTVRYLDLHQSFEFVDTVFTKC
jgi:hypothetical protein